jgi:hypothetical protein
MTAPGSESRFLNKTQSVPHVYGPDNTLPSDINSSSYQRFAVTVLGGGWRGSTHNIFNTYGLSVLPSWDSSKSRVSKMKCILNRNGENNLCLRCNINTIEIVPSFCNIPVRAWRIIIFYLGPTSQEVRRWKHSRIFSFLASYSSHSQSHIATDGQWVYLRCRTQIWDIWTEIFFSFKVIVLSFFGAPSLTRGRLCHVSVFVIEVYHSVL